MTGSLESALCKMACVSSLPATLSMMLDKGRVGEAYDEEPVRAGSPTAGDSSVPRGSP